MADAKIEIEVGQVRFSGEGEQQWLAQQMDKVLKSAESLMEFAAEETTTDNSENGNENSNENSNDNSGDGGLPCTETLPEFLKKVKPSNKTDIFLATAEWLHRKGNTELSTKGVTEALRKAHQSKLSNPSQCLANNVSAGKAEKHGKTFYVTDSGREHLGVE